LTPLGQVNNAVDAVGALAGYNPGDLQTSFQHGAAAAARSVVRGIGALGDIQHKAVNAITGGNRIASFVLQNLNPLGNLPGMSDVQPATQWLGQKAQELENSVQQHGRLAQGADMIGGLIPYLFSGEFAPITMALSGAGNQADAAERQGKYGTTASDIGVIANAGFQGLLGRFIGGDAFAKLAPQFGKALADGIAQRLGGGTADIVGRAVGGLAGDLAQGITNTAFRAAGAGTVGLAMQGGANIIEAETVNPTKDVTEGLGESAGSMAILDLAMHGLRVAGSSVAGRYAQAARGTADANVLDGLHKIAEASKVRERAPDVWHSYLQQVTQEHGAPESVYVSPEAFAQTFSTPEGRVALGNMPDAVRDAVQISAATGGDVKIPTADFGTYVAGTPLYEQLADHIKTDPNSYTRAQAEEIMKTEGPRVLAEMDQAVKGRPRRTNSLRRAIGSKIRSGIRSSRRIATLPRWRGSMPSLAPIPWPPWRRALG
jgi:hypothetical protein